jgi:hypothetical protein
MEGGSVIKRNDDMNMPNSAIAIVVLTCAAGVAGAQNTDDGRVGHLDNWSQQEGWDRARDNMAADAVSTPHRAGWDRAQDSKVATNAATMAAPEVSPASAIAALALLGGALIVLHGRYGIKQRG